MAGTLAPRVASRGDPLSLHRVAERSGCAAPRVLFPEALLAREMLAARVLLRPPPSIPRVLRLASRMMLAARVLLCRPDSTPNARAPPSIPRALRFLRVRPQADVPTHQALTSSTGPC